MRTVAKANVNALSSAMVSTATIGIFENVEPWPVNDIDRAYGYDTAYAIANASGNLLVTAGTCRVGMWAQGAGRTGQAFNYGIRGMDFGSNVVGGGRNIYDIAENGPNFANVTGLITNGVCAGVHVKTFADDMKMKNVTGGLDNNEEVRRWYVEQSRKLTTDNSLPLRERAIQASLRRNELRQQARDMMTDRELAAKLDITDPIQPVSNYVRKTYQEKGLVGDELWEEILKGSTKTRQSVNIQFGINN
jgi:hypothetical protein